MPSSPIPTMDSHRCNAAGWGRLSSASDMKKNILILGGTTEARLLGQELAIRNDMAVTLSLAGRTASPLAQAVPVRSGGFGGTAGLVEYLRILEMLREHGWSAKRCIPHGGHQMSLNIAAGLGLGGNESYPGIFQPFGGFADGIPVQDSYVQLPEIPGVGFEAKNELFRVMKAMVE